MCAYVADCCRRHLLLVALGLAFLVACSGGSGGSEDAGVPGDADGRSAISIDSPSDGQLLESATVDVEVSLDADRPVDGVALFANHERVAETTVDLAEGASAGATLEAVDLGPWDATEAPVTLRARALAGDETAATSEAVQVRVDTRKAAVEALAEASAVEPKIDWDRRGFASFVHMDVPVEGDNPVDRSYRFFERFSDLLRIDEPRQELAPGRVRESEDGQTEVSFEQHVDGMPVYDAALVLVMEGDRALALSGNYVPELPVMRETDAEPVTKSEAERIALDHLEPEKAFLPGVTRKVVFDPAVYDHLADSDPSFAWRVNVQGNEVDGGAPNAWQVFVDLHSGEVLQTQSDARHVKDLRVKVQNAQGKQRPQRGCMTKWFAQSKPACFENIPLRSDGCNSNADGNGDARRALDESIAMHDWLMRHFGWATNKNGGLINHYVDVTYEDGPNATSLGGTCNNQLHYADEWAVPDVVYHEMGHRLVDETGTEFKYQFQPGALDEHYADLFAALVEGEDEGVGFDEQIGEDLPGGAIRNLRTPTGPDHMDDWNVSPNTKAGDFGSVHSNSHIPSKATQLLAEGGAHSETSVDAIGSDKLRKLMFETLKSSMTGESTSFSGYANAMVSKAKQLFSPYRDNACQVRKAFASVGVITGDADCDGKLDGKTNDNDGDGIADGSDNCKNEWNVSQNDADGDGEGDACDRDLDGDGTRNRQDNCPETKNGGQKDRNGDGKGDACQDLDGDFTVDAKDNCPDTSNYAQEDTDGNGQGDACDSDDDGDGVPDGSDNCRQTPNASQDDFDGDGRGDACDNSDEDSLMDDEDPCPSVTLEGDQDLDDDGLWDACEDDNDDGDELPDSEDNCPRKVNNGQDDVDDDGVGDACDNCLSTPNPRQENLDGDWQGDACDDDDDGDGVTDEQDNCPETANARQRDFDSDGTGAACSGTDRLPRWVFSESAAPPGFNVDIPSVEDLEEGHVNWGGDMPIDPCRVAICRDRPYMPAGFRTDVQLEAAFEFRAFVIDGEGQIVGRLHRDQLALNEEGMYSGTVTFAPEASSHFATDAVPSGIYEGQNYYLRVVPHPEYHLTEIPIVSMSIAGRVP